MLLSKLSVSFELSSGTLCLNDAGRLASVGEGKGDASLGVFDVEIGSSFFVSSMSELPMGSFTGVDISSAMPLWEDDRQLAAHGRISLVVGFGLHTMRDQSRSPEDWNPPAFMPGQI